MKKILAVSGGVDSMVMLDLMAKNYSSGDIIVAHFSHGIRPNSDEDANFVREVTEGIYHIRYIDEKGGLGQNASEEAAREARYDFLRQVATSEHGEIYTAHHLDDLTETVAINLLRGTGWRGLACLNAPGIRRPLLEAREIYEPMDKAAIWEYAGKCKLRFREDQSNNSEVYLRNRLRNQLAEEAWTYEQKLKIYQLWQDQKILREQIDSLINALLPAPEAAWSRDWIKELSHDELDIRLALEILRAGALQAGVSATRPQLENLRQAILNYQPGKYFNLPGDKLMRINKNSFNWQ